MYIIMCIIIHQNDLEVGLCSVVVICFKLKKASAICKGLSIEFVFFLYNWALCENFFTHHHRAHHCILFFHICAKIENNWNKQRFLLCKFTNYFSHLLASKSSQYSLTVDFISLRSMRIPKRLGKVIMAMAIPENVQIMVVSVKLATKNPTT